MTFPTFLRARRTLLALLTGTLAACGSDTPTEPPPSPPVPSSLVIVSGNDQRRPPGETLPAPLVVQVNDQRGDAMAGVAISFTVQAGDGAVDPASAQTAADGRAQATWTLGAAEGENRVQVSATGTSVTPVVFRAVGSNLILASVSPDTLREGLSATLTGQGFDATPTNNSVTLSGVPATVTSGTATSLTITVPTRACLPLGLTAVTVTVSNQTSNAVSHPFAPPSFLNLAVGQQLVLKDPADFCLQFRPLAAGADTFLVGVGATSTTVPVLTPMSFLMAARAGASAAGPAPETAPTTVSGSGSRAQGDLRLPRWQAHARAELALRQWERTHLAPSGRAPRTDAAGGPLRAAQAVPNPGDLLTFRVPNIDATDKCTFTEITTRVRRVGTSGIFVTDTLNPKADALTDAEILAQSDTFDLFIHAQTTQYFGSPGDLDANSRVFVVLTWQVNKLGGGDVAGFVFSGDLFPRTPAPGETGCAASDEGEIFYGHVPDPNNAAGTKARSKADVIGDMPSLIAHEFTHNIQMSRRIFELSGTTLLSSWESEGQAVLAEEVVAHKIFNNMPGRDYGASKVFPPFQDAPCPQCDWYNPIFARLALYYGWNGSGKNPNAPELCTIFGSFDINDDAAITCEPFWFYGAVWSLMRYVSDRFGPGWAGGEAGLQRNWIDKSPGLEGVPNIEALLGVKFDTLFAEWAAMHYVDGRVVTANPKLLMTSWNLFDIYSRTPPEVQLQPRVRGFGDFAESRGVQPGGTAYTLITSLAGHRALALRVRGTGAGEPLLGTTADPQFWIVRIR